MLTWNVSVPSADSVATKAALDSIFKNLPFNDQHLGMFCQGAPRILTGNLNPELGLCNGTRAVMQGVGFFDSEEEAALHEQLAAARPGQVVHLQKPPDFILVRVGIGADAIDVPIIEVQDEMVLKAMSRGKQKKKCLRHAVELAFAIPYYKAQGQTMQHAVLHLSEFNAATALSMFLVGISRVTDSSGVRIFSPTEKEVEVIRGAVPDQELREYMKKIKR